MKNNFSSSASVCLDIIRGLAALAVASGHVRSLFFVNHSDVRQPNALVDFIYLITGFGHQSVVIFFVLSGLLIGAMLISQHKEGNWAWDNYLIARLTRLYVVLIPGLLLTFIWDSLGSSLSVNSGVYSGNPNFGNIIAFNVAQNLTMRAFIGNLFFLQTIASPILGSNTPLWSLSYEFWYYLLFPLCFFLFTLRKKPSYLKFGNLLLIVALLFFIGRAPRIYYCIWLMGVLVAKIGAFGIQFSMKTIRLLLPLSIIQFCIALALTKKLSLNDTVMDVALGVSISMMLYVFVRTPNLAVTRFIAKIARTLSGFSYTLYVTHLPFVLFLHCLFFSSFGKMSIQRWQPNATRGILGCTILLIVVTYAFLLSSLTERNTAWFRSFVFNSYRRVLAMTKIRRPF